MRFLGTYFRGWVNLRRGSDGLFCFWEVTRLRLRCGVVALASHGTRENPRCVLSKLQHVLYNHKLPFNFGLFPLEISDQ